MTDAINRDTRTSIYFGFSFVLALPWQPDRGKCVDFQKSLLNNGLDFDQTNQRPNGFMLRRNKPSNLQVTLDRPAEQLSGIQVVAANPQYDLDMFIRDGSAALSAYHKIWPREQYQVIRTGAKIQHLYSCSDHAFKYLWEQRLGQKPEDFASLGGRPVAGGGLRLIMPPYSVGDEEPFSGEIRVESFLKEKNKILIETAFTWPKPTVIANNANLNCAKYMRKLDEFASNQVWEFLSLNKG